MLAVGLMFAMAAVAILVAVLTRRASDAILASYSTLIIVFLAIFTFTPPVPRWLDAPALLSDLAVVPGSARSALISRCILATAACTALGTLCVYVASRQLRRAHARHAESRISTWLWALRPAIGNDPVGWRERYAIGLAPLPILRRVPVPLGLTGVLTFSAIMALVGLDNASAHNFFAACKHFDLAGAWRWMTRPLNPDRLPDEVMIMGIVLAIAGIITVGVRSATCITEEKRRKTWDDLMVTDLTFDEIVRGKRKGILRAAMPYLAVYALPMFLLAGRGNCIDTAMIALFLGGSGILMAAYLGTAFSGTDKDREAINAREYRPSAFEMPSNSGLVEVGGKPLVMPSRATLLVRCVIAGAVAAVASYGCVNDGVGILEAIDFHLRLQLPYVAAYWRLIQLCCAGAAAGLVATGIAHRTQNPQYVGIALAIVFGMLSAAMVSAPPWHELYLR
jgi:hypothetical protein